MSIEHEIEKQIIKNARKKAEQIIVEAEEVSRQIYASSLEYVDDMLTEVNIAALRAKENMRMAMEQMLEEFDIKISIIEQNKTEILEQLREMSENGNRPVKKAQYEIKIDEAYIPKQSFQIKTGIDGEEKKEEVHRSAKQSFEIKIADEWKDRIESLSAITQEPEIIKPPEPEIEPEPEEEEGFRAEDFDLDSEYFAWLEEDRKK